MRFAPNPAAGCLLSDCVHCPKESSIYPSHSIKEFCYVFPQVRARSENGAAQTNRMQQPDSEISSRPSHMPDIGTFAPYWYALGLCHSNSAATKNRAFARVTDGTTRYVACEEVCDWT